MKISRIVAATVLGAGIFFDALAVLLLVAWLFGPADRHGNVFLFIGAWPIALVGFAFTTAGLVGLLKPKPADQSRAAV